MLWLAVAALPFALLPALLFLRNAPQFRVPPEVPRGALRPRISLLIPARDEERSIGPALEAALASTGVELEVVVLDDGSTDRTAQIVRTIADRDPRVRLEIAPPLPAGLRGKPHACAVLAEQARYEILAFQDADVRLAPDGLARAAAFLEASGAGLVSGFPRQETGTPLEVLLIPLMHWVLLGFLPIDRMRQSRHPAYGAACGQLLLARRSAYQAAGGHRAIARFVHDALKLARAFRAAGFATDLFDATPIASCRMYENAPQVWEGLAKNATEGMGAPVAIIPWTLVLGLGQVAPPILLAVGLATGASAWVLGLSALALAAGWNARLAAAARFRQPRLGALLHPLGIALFLAIQWHALARHLAGKPAVWKGRELAG